MSENSIKAGIVNLAKRANILISESMINIVKHTNQKINKFYNLCKIQLTSKEDVAKIISLNGGFRTKQGHVIVKKFTSSIHNINAKIANNNQRFPSENIVEKPVTNQEMVKVTNTQAITSSNNLERIGKIEFRLEDMFINITEKMQFIVNHLTPHKSI